MSAQPLSGIRVMELGHEWSCPHTTRLLADFGAEVIKVEYVRRLDIMRGARKDGNAYNHQPRFLQLNRNKRSLTLDLRDLHDADIFKDLVAVSDVVVENSRPGVLNRLGLGYEVLKSIRPDIILVSMSAFGKTGPEADYAGYGGTIEAISGIQSLTAYETGSMPRRIKEMDVTNGIMGACAVLTALIHHQNTGQGEWVDLSEVEAATHGLIGEHFLEYAVNEASSLPVGNRNPAYTPQGCYRCKGEDKWIVISISSEQEWQSFCVVTEHPEWGEDPQFASHSERTKNHDRLDRLIETWSIEYTHLEAMQILQNAGIAAGAVLNVAEVSQDPHIEQRKFFQKPNSGSEELFAGFPFRLSKGGGVVDRPGPELGEENHYIICELLGKPPERVKPILSDEIGTSYDS